MIGIFFIPEQYRSLLIFLAYISIALLVYALGEVREEFKRQEKYNDYLKKQLSLLKVLIEELNFLKNNLEAYKETFSKERHYSLYEL